MVLAAGLLGLGLARVPSGGADKERGPLLVTSTIGATSAFLFVIDPQTRNLATYEATPGENGGLKLLGARKIEHDLELAKFRDLSEFSYFDLRDKKNEVGGKGDDVKGAAGNK
jgi:hypothetical protein